VPADAVAPSLLREARRRSGLSQRELARRAGITQPVVAAYESAKRQPTFPTLLRLLHAAGCELDLGLRPAPDRSVADGDRAEQLAAVLDLVDHLPHPQRDEGPAARRTG
jgi:transcriptional regulator with XRE-family HTH domain